MKRIFLFIAVCSLASSTTLDAQRGGRGRAAGPALSPKQAAPIDLAGYWVSPIIEDWKYRMVTPTKGVFDAVPLNPEGRKVGERSEEHTSELQSLRHLVCRLLLEKKKK